MAIGSFTQAVQLATSSQARAVPHVLSDRHIFTQHLFPFISKFFSVDEPSLGPGQQKFKMPGQIKSQRTWVMQPKLYDFGSLPTQFTANGAVAALTLDTNANLTLTATTGLRKYAKLKNRATGAVVQVQSVTSSTVVVVKAFAGGAAGNGIDAIADASKFDFIGYAYPDGAQTQIGNRATPQERSNYLELDITETDIGIMAERFKLFPDSTNGHENNLLINAMQHNEGRERRMLFGEVRDDSATITGETITAMKGLEAWSDVEYDAGGTLTMDEYRMTVAPVIWQAGGGSKKYALAGNTVMSVFDNLLDGRVVYDKNPDKLGVRTKFVEAAAGMLEIMGSQPMHEREGMMMCFDPELMTRFYLEGLDMALMKEVGPSDYMRKRDAWVTCETLLVHNPDSIAIVTNILG